MSPGKTPEEVARDPGAVTVRGALSDDDGMFTFNLIYNVFYSFF